MISRGRTAATMTAVFALTVSGCRGAESPGTAEVTRPGAAAAEDIAGEWSLLQYPGFREEGFDRSITLTFEPGRASGHSGCNNYSAEISGRHGIMRFGPVAITKMACMDEGIMRTERSYLTMLSSVRTYSLEDDRLTLQGAEGTLVLQRGSPGRAQDMVEP